MECLTMKMNLYLSIDANILDLEIPLIDAEFDGVKIGHRKTSLVVLLSQRFHFLG